MKTILFFDRPALTTLYAMMTKYMYDINTIHIAYSEEDVKELSTYGIKPALVYLDKFKYEYDHCDVNDEVLNEIDKDILTYTGGRFNLNEAIQCDRGFSILNYNECLRSAVAHYRIWKSIFEEQHVDLLAHEPCSLFFNFIASVLCKKQGGFYSYQIACMSDKYEYSYLNCNNDEYDYLELRRAFEKYNNNPNLIDIERCENYLNKFRNDYSVFFSVINKKQSFLRLAYRAIRNFIYTKIKLNDRIKIYNNIKYWISSYNTPWRKMKNLFCYRLEGVKFIDTIPENEKYLFYPIHLEPEAVVSYLGDNIYSNQIKLIENIAASLPPGYFLYVKDHPHEYAYRSADDYKRLMNIPNIRLLNQWIPGKAIVAKSDGVVTINGTAGLEAMLMNKHVFCFGRNQYSFVPRINFVKNIRDLKDVIYKNINKIYSDDNELYAYIMAYLESGHPGYVNCFMGGPWLKTINYENNAKIIASEMMKYVDYL